MGKRLLLGAAALIVSTGGAAAGHSVTDIRLDGYCNTYHIKIAGVVAAAQDSPSCSGTYGGGLVATVKNFGKSVDLALQDAAGPGVQLMLELSYPFTDGGVFKLYQTVDGTSFNEALDGTYSIITSPDAGPKNDPSVTSRIRR